MATKSNKVTKYTLVQVEHFDGKVTFQIQDNLGEVVREFPSDASNFAIEALKRIKEYNGLAKETPMYEVDVAEET